MTGYKGTAPFDSWLISPAIDIKKAPNKLLSFRTQVNGYSSTTTHFEVYLMSTADPTTATLIKLNPTIATAPASGYSSWAESGNLDLSQYEGTYFIGFRYEAATDANYATWCVDDVKFGEGGGGGGTPDPQPVIGNRADLETMNGGAAKSTYGSYSSTQGWKGANCNILMGGDADSNPVFKFLGKVEGTETWAMGVTINGKTSAVGTLTSPVISGSINELHFNYAMPYTDTAISFRVDIMKNGQVVKTETVTNSAPVKLQVYEHTMTGLNVTGDFQIVFTNLSPTAQDANKDRVCLFNITWKNVE